MFGQIGPLVMLWTWTFSQCTYILILLAIHARGRLRGGGSGGGGAVQLLVCWRAVVRWLRVRLIGVCGREGDQDGDRFIETVDNLKQNTKTIKFTIFSLQARYPELKEVGRWGKTALDGWAADADAFQGVSHKISPPWAVWALHLVDLPWSAKWRLVLCFFT